MWPFQVSFLFIVFRIFLSSLTLCNTFSFLTLSVQRSSPSFPSATSQNLPGISDLFPKFPSLSTHTAILHMYHFASFFHKFKLAGENSLLVVESCYCHDNPGLNLLRTSCTISYHATQVVELFSACFWSAIICCEDGYIEILIPLVFFHIHFHSISPSNFN